MFFGDNYLGFQALANARGISVLANFEYTETIPELFTAVLPCKSHNQTHRRLLQSVVQCIHIYIHTVYAYCTAKAVLSFTACCHASIRMKGSIICYSADTAG